MELIKLAAGAILKRAGLDINWVKDNEPFDSESDLSEFLGWDEGKVMPSSAYPADKSGFRGQLYNEIINALTKQHLYGDSEESPITSPDKVKEIANAIEQALAKKEDSDIQGYGVNKKSLDNLIQLMRTMSDQGASMHANY